MKLIALTAAILPLALAAFARDGQTQIHDPSTIVPGDGKFYTYGTGGTTLVADDGWTWIRGAAPARRGMAPDIIHLGDRYCLYVARNIGAQPKADINLIWSKSLDTNSPDYQWEEAGVVASSDGVEDCNAVDPGGLLDLGEGVRKFSCHYEADLDRGGASVLDIRRLLWRDGWPVAGDNLRDGTFQIESVCTGTALELAVQGVPVGGARPRRGPPGAGGFGGPGGPAANAPGGAPGGGILGGTGRGPIPPPDVAQVSTNWPAGNVGT